MNSRKNLAAQVAGAMAIAALVGTSAFAETRHSDATERDHNRQSSVDRSSRYERRDRSGRRTRIVLGTPAEGEPAFGREHVPQIDRVRLDHVRVDVGQFAVEFRLCETVVF